MQILSGSAIMEQIVAGKLRFYHRRRLEFQTRSGQDCRREELRFHIAQEQAVVELSGLYDQAAVQVGHGIASIFTVHAMLLKDGDFTRTVHTLIRDEGVTAEYAVQRAGSYFAAVFSAMDSPYMQARATDFRDISRRVIRALMGGWPAPSLREPAILVADEFLPSEVLAFNHKLLGLIARKESLDSHTSMLLRAYHIPAMVDMDLDEAWEGHPALMDGHQGRVYLDPEQALMEALRERYQAGGRPELCAV